VKALRLHAAGELRLHDEPDPVPGPGELLLRVTAVGLCGSDRHWFTEGAIGDARLDRPLVLGHEVGATIAAGPRAGERVAVDPALPCGACDVCLRGDDHLCPHGRFAGHGATDGGLRTLLAWPAHLVEPVPDWLPDADVALLEPLGVALHALELGKVVAGSTACVVGCGPIGLLLVQLLALAGASSVGAVEPLPHRAAAAEAAGATVVAGEPEASLRDRFDVVFDVAGTDEAVDAALWAAAPGGRVVLVGIPDGDRTVFSASLARRKGLSLLLSRRMRSSHLARAATLVSDRRVDLGGLVGERHPLAAGGPAWEALVSRRTLKVVVDPREVAP
jgi:L-iditol 2-dehydrogenase